MWIVRLALRRPYTFVVLSLLLFIIGPVVMLRTPVDIFPNIDIPVVSIVWAYAGLSPEQLNDRIVLPYERNLYDRSQRHRTHRIPDAEWRLRRKGFLSAISKHCAGGGTGYGGLTDSASPGSAGHDTTADNPVQRLERPSVATWIVWPRSQRTAVERLWHQLHPHTAGYSSGRFHAISLWRQAAPNSGGY